MEELSTDFRVYALDHLGFGESRDRAGRFTVDQYIKSVSLFMEKQGIQKAALVGHSMGGTVSLGVAKNRPDQVAKVTIIGSPINGASLALLLKLSGYEAIARLFWTFPFLLRLFMKYYAYFIANNGTEMSRMLVHDVSKITAESYFMSIATLRRTDLRGQISGLTMPVMGMYGPKDVIVNPNQAKLLKAEIPTAQIAWFENSGHFVMLDSPERFHKELREFLHNT
jgi:pimeloyl-ACP methyl ester carboxylesterase